MDNIRLRSPRGWINDPNGFIFYKGKYHLFYQHFPYSAQWGRMHWGHAVSDELCGWEHLDIALYPSKAEDRSGCFSGSAVAHEGKMYIYYTGVDYTDEDPENINVYRNEGFRAAQMMIVSEDGDTFDNLKSKRVVIPVMDDSSIGSAVHTRDPKVWRGNDAWYMVLGSTADMKGRLLFYRSYDLEKWEYVNFCEKDGLGWMWECPDYFEVNGQGIAVFSPIGILSGGKAYEAAAVCALADFNEADCSMNIHDGYRLIDIGNDLYAPQSSLDKDGRRVLIAWARCPESHDGKRSGIFCIPRIVEYSDGHIYFRPHTDVTGKFTKKITSLSESEGCWRLSMDMTDGQDISIGGYRISCNDNIITADRSDVFRGHDEIMCVFSTPELKNGRRIDVYGDDMLIEVYINDGEYVISNVVYELGNEIVGNGYELYTC